MLSSLSYCLISFADDLAYACRQQVAKVENLQTRPLRKFQTVSLSRRQSSKATKIAGKKICILQNRTEAKICRLGNEICKLGSEMKESVQLKN